MINLATTQELKAELRENIRITDEDFDCPGCRRERSEEWERHHDRYHEIVSELCDREMVDFIDGLDFDLEMMFDLSERTLGEAITELTASWRTAWETAIRLRLAFDPLSLILEDHDEDSQCEQ